VVIASCVTILIQSRSISASTNARIARTARTARIAHCFDVLLCCLKYIVNIQYLLMVAFSAHHGDGKGQVFVFFIMAVAAAEVAVGLSILIMMHRNTNTTDIGFLNKLKF
jgi:NADH-quinone oxidoreductase subunit K